MQIGPTEIEDTFAEAFRTRFARLVVTAHDEHWLDAGLRAATGAATSVIACDCEAGCERRLGTGETPDGRAGAAVLLFAFTAHAVGDALLRRAGQCLLTCPTAAAYDGALTEQPGAPDERERVPLGRSLRFFGDGFQKSKVIGGRRYWRIPVMGGEFVVEESALVGKGIAGGNFLIQGETLEATLEAARRAVDAIAPLAGSITPFPGGVVQSGSKVGSRYRALKASTNQDHCPTLRGRTPRTEPPSLHPAANAVLEIVIDGVDELSIAKAMRVGIHAAVGDGVPAISAGNYGGRLGKFLFKLHEVLA